MHTLIMCNIVSDFLKVDREELDCTFCGYISDRLCMLMIAAMMVFLLSCKLGIWSAGGGGGGGEAMKNKKKK